MRATNKKVGGASYASTLMLVFTGAVTMMGAACASSGAPFIWVDELPERSKEPEPYYIRAGDELDILVWNQDRLSGVVRVRREDGRATIPLVGDVALAGLSTQAAAEQIVRSLEGLVVDPKVTVGIKTSSQAMISVVGQVRNPGRYALNSGDGVLHMIASAGGLGEFADGDRVFVMRSHPDLIRVRFRYEDLTRGVGTGWKFTLRDGDVVVVE